MNRASVHYNTGRTCQKTLVRFTNSTNDPPAMLSRGDLSSNPSMIDNKRIRRKRSRNRSSTSRSNGVTAFLTVAGSAILFSATSASAFSVPSNGPLHSKLSPQPTGRVLCAGSSSCRSSSSSFTSLFAVQSTALRRSTSSSISRRSASSSSHLMVEPMKPITAKSSVSKERRQAARDAYMKERTSIESALEGVDAQVLELLSEDFLYPRTTISSLAAAAAVASSTATPPMPEPQHKHPLSYSRPSGRPESVPGAMTRASMKLYQEKRDRMHNVARGTHDGDILAVSTKGTDEGLQSRSTTGRQRGEQEEENPPTTERIMEEGLREEFEEAQMHVQSTEVGSKTKQRPRLRGMTSGTVTDNSNEDETSALPDTTSARTLTTTQDDDDNSGSSSSSTAPKKSRKRVVKNLPNSKDVPEPSNSYGTQEAQPELLTVDTTAGGRQNEEFIPPVMYDPSRRGKNPRAGGGEINNLELRKYYATDLLTSDQEFDLGQKIQMMIACEQVHEGLSIDLMRLPTIREWATACGYVEADPDFVCNSILERQIRPVGCENMFEETDPNMFVGNGLAHTAGVGRGRGRAKKAPPNKLKDVYDERDVGKPKSKRTPINRGTPTTFCDMMMDGRDAKQLMVQSNMRLVVSISRKYSKVGISLQDLVQEGSLGLSRAAEKYDPTMGFKFSTYASWWIQQAVFRAIAYHSRTIRLPVHIHNMMNRVRKVRNSLQQGLGRLPTDEEMADAMDMPPSRYRRMIRLTRKSISLELPQYMQNAKDYGHEGDDSIADMTSSSGLGSDSEIVSPEKSVDRSLFHEDLKEMLTILDDDERKVIELRYGLNDGLTRTVTSVAAEMRQTPGWIRSHESKALRKLRRPWYEKKLLEHQHALIN